MAQQQPQARQVPIVVVGLDDEPILFSNQFYIQHHQTEFIITFCQIQPPLLIGTPEQIQQQAEHVTSVPARAVARIGLTHTRMMELVRVLQQNLQQYERARGQQP